MRARTILAFAVGGCSVLLAAGCTSLLGDDFVVKPTASGGSGGAPSGGTGGASPAGSGGFAGTASGASGVSGKGGAAGESGAGGEMGGAGNGGLGGEAGSAGVGAAAGESGAAGDAGAGGTAGNGGAAGEAGAAGAAGAAGQAGAAGTAGQAGSAGAGGAAIVHPAIDRDYVVACFIPIVAQPRPVLFAGKLKSNENSTTVTMTVQLLLTSATSLKSTVPGATKYSTSGTIGAGGSFKIGFPDNVTVLDAGNPFTAADSEFASPVFEGSLANLDRVCGTVTGAIVEPSFPVPGAPCVFEVVDGSGTFVPPGNADCKACPAPAPATGPMSKGPPVCPATPFDCSACPKVTSGRLTAFASDSATWCDARTYCASIGKRLAAPNARELEQLSNDLDNSGDFPTPSLLVGFQQPAGSKSASSPWCTATDTPVEVVSLPPGYYVLDDRGLDGNENGEADCGSLRAGGTDGLQVKDVDCKKPLKGFLCEELPPGSGAGGNAGSGGAAGNGGAGG